jgi:hypothetical protein
MEDFGGSCFCVVDCLDLIILFSSVHSKIHRSFCVTVALISQGICRRYANMSAAEQVREKRDNQDGRRSVVSIQSCSDPRGRSRRHPAVLYVIGVMNSLHSVCILKKNSIYLFQG